MNAGKRSEARLYKNGSSWVPESLVPEMREAAVFSSLFLRLMFNMVPDQQFVL